MSELKHWVWLSGLAGVSGASKQALLERFGSPGAVYFANPSAYAGELGLRPGELEAVSDKSPRRAEEILEKCAGLGVSILTIQDALYPERLRNIPAPPLVLYIKGRLPDLDALAAVAIVGTRRASPYGVRMARKLGYELGSAGALIVSGLAQGVDAAAMEGALLAGGRCVGVLGTAIDQVYPASSRRLFEDVSATGALVSEYPPGAVTTRGSFPVRNRIISGLSLGVIIVEAPQRSGSLITADRAIEQGRDVFSVPGNADYEGCAGSNALIKEGIRAITCAADVLAEYKERYPELLPVRPAPAPVQSDPETPNSQPESPTKPASPDSDFFRFRVPSGKKVIDKENSGEYIDLEEQLKGLSESQLRIISQLGPEAVHVDDLIERCALPAQTVLSDMTFLQIKGYVSQEKGKRFRLNIIKKRG